ncbi:MAG TPA: hypothetical protein VFS75_03160 [Candidatus Paceibacterota bacterium]|nr:hypothetical protein [Candidatus Paceibacterota bacterium]
MRKLDPEGMVRLKAAEALAGSDVKKVPEAVKRVLDGQGGLPPLTHAPKRAFLSHLIEKQLVAIIAMKRRSAPA